MEMAQSTTELLHPGVATSQVFRFNPPVNKFHPCPGCQLSNGKEGNPCTIHRICHQATAMGGRWRMRQGGSDALEETPSLCGRQGSEGTGI